MRPAHLLAAAVAAAFATQTSAQTPKVVMEEMTVPSELGIEIYVRNKRPADERIPTRAYGRVRARRRLSSPHFVRSQARRHVVDGRAATTSLSSTFAATAPPPVRKRWTRRPRPTHRWCAARRRHHECPVRRFREGPVQMKRREIIMLIRVILFIGC